MKNYLNKNNNLEKSKNNNDKLRKQKIINIKENSNENTLKHHKTVIYKKNNLSNSLAKTGKKDIVLKKTNQEIDMSNFNSGKKSNNFDTSQREKRIDIYELYLKKYAHKLQNKAGSYSEKDRCKTPMSNYNKILNNKLSIPSLIHQSENNEPNKKKESNCFTFVDRKKDIKYIEVDEKDEKEENKPSSTLEANHNHYIYNKPNIIIKKQNSTKKKIDNISQDRPSSATPIYKRAPKLNPSLYKSNIPNTNNSYRKDKIHNYKETSDNIPSNIKKDNENNQVNNQENNQIYPHKLNRYYSYGVSITTPTNSKIKTNINENDNILHKNPSTVISPKSNSNFSKKYIKKLNVKSYQQKLNAIQNDNFYEKKAMYGKIYEREKNEQKNKEKEKNKGKNKNNINIGNTSTNNKNGSLITNNSNAFLHHIKSLNNHEGVNGVLNCYLSPKNNNSQVFNNFYSINLPVPVKVINVFKK